MLQIVAKRKTRPPGGRRVGRAEVERRLALAETMLRDGYPRSAIVTAMRAKFGTSTRAADNYIARVRDRWVRDREASRPADEAQTEARLSALSRKLEGRGAFSEMVKVERLLAEVRGLRGPRSAAQAVARPASIPDMTEEEGRAQLDHLRNVLDSMDLYEKMKASDATGIPLDGVYTPVPSGPAALAEQARRRGLPAFSPARPPVGLLAQAMGDDEPEPVERAPSPLARAAAAAARERALRAV